MPRQLWIADAARAAGLNVVECSGWQTRGSETFSPQGLVLHHTGGPASGDIPSLPILINGRSDLPGPLCQYGLARSGTVYVVAAGRANHAGSGGWDGLSGNTSVFGIEAENTGLGEPWPAAQLDAYHRLAAVLCQRTPFGPGRVCAHREWAPTRKVDPTGIDMTQFRAAVAALLQEDDMTEAQYNALMAVVQEARQNSIDTKNYVIQVVIPKLNEMAANGSTGTSPAEVADELARRLGA